MRIELNRGKLFRLTRGAGSTVISDADLSVEHSERASIACADSV